MADFESVQNDLTAALQTVLTTASVSLVLENSPAPTSPRAPTAEWAEVRIVTAGRITEINSPIARHEGRMLIELYTQLGKGAARAAALSDAIALAFQGIRVGAAACYEVDPRGGFRDEGGAHWHSGCSVRFKWEHTPA